MSYSAGVWTFPSTGYWEVRAWLETINSNNDSRYMYLDYSADGGSSWIGSVGSGAALGLYYTDRVYAQNGAPREVNLTSYHHITNASNQKIRYIYKTPGYGLFKGSASYVISNFSFKKVA